MRSTLRHLALLGIAALSLGSVGCAVTTVEDVRMAPPGAGEERTYSIQLESADRAVRTALEELDVGIVEDYEDSGGVTVILGQRKRHRGSFIRVRFTAVAPSLTKIEVYRRVRDSLVQIGTGPSVDEVFQEVEAVLETMGALPAS